MKKLFLVLCTLVLSFAFIGCSNSNSAGSGSNDQATTRSDFDDNNGPNSSTNASGLDGKWTACDVFSENGQDFADYYEVNFDGNTFTNIVRYYDGQTTCTGTPVYTQTGSGTLVFGDDIMTNSGVTATEIDVDGAYSDSDGDSFELIYYDIYYIDNDQLYLGSEDSGEGDTPENRPTDIDFSTFYTSQP